MGLVSFLPRVPLSSVLKPAFLPGMGAMREASVIASREGANKGAGGGRRGANTEYMGQPALLTGNC